MLSHVAYSSYFRELRIVKFARAGNHLPNPYRGTFLFIFLSQSAITTSPIKTSVYKYPNLQRHSTPRGRVLERAKVPQLVKEFPVFNVTQRIIVFK